MTILANLARLTEQATASEKQYHRHMESLEARLVLKDSAPQMAELLIECEEELRRAREVAQVEHYWLSEERIDVLLARLADFDKELT